MKLNFPIKTFVLLWLSHFYLDFFLGIWPIYKTLAQINIAQAGLIMGAAGFIGEILQLGFGYFSDTGHRKKILIFGMLCGSAILFVTFTSGFLSLLALMMCLMIGSGSYHPAAVGMASGLFPKKRALYSLVHYGGSIRVGDFANYFFQIFRMV